MFLSVLIEASPKDKEGVTSESSFIKMKILMSLIEFWKVSTPI